MKINIAKKSDVTIHLRQHWLKSPYTTIVSIGDPGEALPLLLEKYVAEHHLSLLRLEFTDLLPIPGEFDELPEAVPTPELIRRVIDFGQQTLNENSSILIHDVTSLTRSPAVATALLLSVFPKMRTYQALMTPLEGKRHPNPYFLYLLDREIQAMGMLMLEYYDQYKNFPEIEHYAGWKPEQWFMKIRNDLKLPANLERRNKMLEKDPNLKIAYA